MPIDSLPAPFFAPGDYEGVPEQVPTQFTPAAPSNVNTPDVPLPLPEGSDNPKHVQVFAYDPLTQQFKPVNWVDGQLSVDATFSGSISVGAVTLKDGTSGTLGSIIPVGTVNAQVVTTQRASTLNTNQVSVGNTPTLIVAANTSRKRIVITNLGTTNVFIGGSAVTTTTGQLLQGLAGYPLALYCTGAIYGVATPNQSVAYSEEAI